MKRALLPKHERLLHELGENLRMARLRRNLPSEQVAERAGIARNTLIKIENGDEGVAIGSYLRVLFEPQRTHQRFGIRTGDGCGPYFGVEESKAAQIIADTKSIVGTWRKWASHFHISREEQELMASAFRS